MPLKEYRDKIDKADKQIVDLINERAKAVIEIGKIKNKSNAQIFSPMREREVYRKITELNKGPVPDKILKAIYREIMSGSIALEKKLTIAYLGPAATFTHQAAQAKFGSSLDYVPATTIADVFYKVESGQADYGVVPIENSTEGAVSHTLDMFFKSKLKIYSEILLEISQCLLSNQKLDQIHKIYSKREVFGQCRLWLRANLPSAECLEVSSTAHAAEIAKKEKNSAAIASELASTLYSVPIIQKSIEDSPHNVTRFFIIGKKDSPPSGSDKTSIIFSTEDKSGALYETLGVFKSFKINLSMIESRPSRKKVWEYYFFVDFDGHKTETKVKEALKKLRAQCQSIKILGSYPKSL
jgi:chorismate mutase / prephenate dehydratase